MPHHDAYATFIHREITLRHTWAAREALVDAAIAARRHGAQERPVTPTAAQQFRRLVGASRPLRGLVRLAQT